MRDQRSMEFLGQVKKHLNKKGNTNVSDTTTTSRMNVMRKDCQHDCESNWDIAETSSAGWG